MYYHVTPIENLESILQVGLVPMVGERSSALGERTPRVYLFTSFDACEDALLNWLGEQFEDVPENGLVILEVEPTALSGESEAGYEFACSDTVAPERIVRVLDETGDSIHQIAPAAKSSAMRMA